MLSKVGVNQLTDDHRSVQPVDSTHYDSLYEVANRILKNALRFTGSYIYNNHDDDDDRGDDADNDDDNDCGDDDFISINIFDDNNSSNDDDDDDEYNIFNILHSSR